MANRAKRAQIAILGAPARLHGESRKKRSDDHSGRAKVCGPLVGGMRLKAGLYCIAKLFISQRKMFKQQLVCLKADVLFETASPKNIGYPCVALFSALPIPQYFWPALFEQAFAICRADGIWIFLFANLISRPFPFRKALTTGLVYCVIAGRAQL